MSDTTFADPSANQSQIKELTSFIAEQIQVAQPALFKSAALVDLLKEKVLAENQHSQMPGDLWVGIVDHPFNFSAVDQLRESNSYHSSALESKEACAFGMGFKSAKVTEVLDPLTDYGFMDVMKRTGCDLLEVGNGYMEIVRDRPGGTIVGVHHVPAADVRVWVEQESPGANFWHFVVGQNALRWAHYPRHGDAEGMRARVANFQQTSPGTDPTNGQWFDMVTERSELLHFRIPWKRSRYYGYPEWLAAVPSIELLQALMQNEFGYYWNRAVPELLILIRGGKLTDDQMNSLKTCLASHIGTRNHHKSSVVNIPQSEVEVDIHKLAKETQDEGKRFELVSGTSSMQVVSAHGTPPILAGLQIPGSRGVNEVVQSLHLFQLLRVAPIQVLVSNRLACAFGADDAGLGLTKADFDGTNDDTLGEIEQMDGMDVLCATRKQRGKGNAFVTINEQLDLSQLSDVSRMRDSALGAERDASQGVARNGREGAQARGESVRSTEA